MTERLGGEFRGLDERLAVIQARIAAVERPFEHNVEVIPVTKGFAGNAIEAAVDAGCRNILMTNTSKWLSNRACARGRPSN